MVTKEQLKAQRHQLYCNIADACQQGSVDLSTDGATGLLGQLQLVLEAESSMSFIEEDRALQYDMPAQQQHGSHPRHSPAHQQLQRDASGHSPSMSAAAAVQLLKEELAQKVHAAVNKQYSPQVDPNKSSIALVADLAAAHRAQAQAEEQLIAAQTALLKHKQQHKHDVKTWKLAAEQAATLAESANKRAAAAEAKLANSSIAMADQAQQLAQQAQAVLRLGSQLKQLQQQLEARSQSQQKLCDAVLWPIFRWYQSVVDSSTHSSELAVNITTPYSVGSLTGTKPEPAVVFDQVFLDAAAAVAERLLLCATAAQHAAAETQKQQQQQSQQREQQLQRDIKHLQENLEEANNATSTLQQQLQEAHGMVESMEQQKQEVQQQLTDSIQAASADLQRLLQEKDAALETSIQEAVRQAEVQAQCALDCKQQQVQELQQQLRQVLEELAAVQEQAAEGRQQVLQLQQQLEQAVSIAEQQREEGRDELKDRLAQQHTADLANQQQAMEQLLADKEAAVRGAEQQAAQAMQMTIREHRLALMEAKAAWEHEKAALERQHLEAALATRLAAQEALYQEQQQWQQDRDTVVQQLTMKHTAADMQAQAHLQELQQQLSQAKLANEDLSKRLAAATSAPQLPGPALTVPGTGVAVAGSPAAGCSGMPGTGGYAVQWSQAITAAEADRRAAVQETVAAGQETQRLRGELAQQEQELLHMRRALDELHRACEAANGACREAEASAAASAAALQERHAQVRQLQCEVKSQKRQHEQELLSLQQSMRDQIALIQSDARAELEAAQTRMQLLRLKQKRFAQCLSLDNCT